MFALFLVTWFITRHIFSVLITYSTIIEAPKLVDLVWDPSQGKYLSPVSLGVFGALLVSLQVRASFVKTHNQKLT